MKYVILAGGSGSRLWPLSRRLFAKQFLNLINEKTLLQNSIARIPEKSRDDIYIVTNNDSKFIVSDQVLDIIPNFKKENIIVEPVCMGTAYAVINSLIYFDLSDIVVVLSSDHYIEDEKQFGEILLESKKIANDNYIVTIGAKIEAAKTGYGYIKKSDKKIGIGYKALEFYEKPELNKINEFIKDQSYLWNGGIFIFKVDLLLNELKKNNPLLFELYNKLKNKFKSCGKIESEDFNECSDLSFDKAILEKTDKLVVVPINFRLRDMASFQSIYDVLPHDRNYNAIKMNKDDFINIDSTNLLVYGTERKIATINVNNLIIVDTPDALLICDKNRTDDVEKVVKILQEKKSPVSESHITVYRPWGSYTILDVGYNYQVKELTVRPGKKISLQYHKHRSETWTVVQGVAEVVKDKEYLTLFPSQSVFIPANSHHRLYNPLTNVPLRLIEVQTGDYLGEDDIIRLQDDFDRC